MAQFYLLDENNQIYPTTLEDWHKSTSHNKVLRKTDISPNQSVVTYFTGYNTDYPNVPALVFRTILNSNTNTGRYFLSDSYSNAMAAHNELVKETQE